MSANNAYERGFEECRRQAASAICSRCKDFAAKSPNETDFTKIRGTWVHVPGAVNYVCQAQAIWNLPQPEDPEKPA